MHSESGHRQGFGGFTYFNTVCYRVLTLVVFVSPAVTSKLLLTLLLFGFLSDILSIMEVQLRFSFCLRVPPHRLSPLLLRDVFTCTPVPSLCHPCHFVVVFVVLLFRGTVFSAPGHFLALKY